MLVLKQKRVTFDYTIFKHLVHSERLDNAYKEIKIKGTCNRGRGGSNLPPTFESTIERECIFFNSRNAFINKIYSLK